MKSSTLCMLATAIMVGLTSANEVFVRNYFDQELPPADAAAIDQAGAVWLGEVAPTGGTRRKLRGGDRDLQYQCNYWCAGFPCGQCYIWKPQCWNWCPRRLQEDEAMPPMPANVRKLSIANEICQEKIDEALLIMGNAVSGVAENIVATSHFNCYEEIDEVQDFCKGIESWNLWDSVTSQITKANFQNSTSVCASEIPTKNLESVVSSACDVSQVNYVVTGPGGYRYSHTEKNSLYFLHGNRANAVTNGFEDWPAGDFVLAATVTLVNGTVKKTGLTFTVNGSC